MPSNRTNAIAMAFAVLLLVAALEVDARFGLSTDNKPDPDKLELAKQKVKHATEEMHEAEQILAGEEPSIARNLANKLTGLFNRDKPTSGDIGDRTKNALYGAYEKTKSIMSPESYENWLHRLKVAAGAEDPTLWERIKSVFGRSESPVDQLKHVFGQETPTEEGLWERVKHVVAPAEAQSPGLLGRLKTALGSRATDSVAMTASDFMHKVKVAIGAEDPTLWEKIKSSFGHQNLMDRAFSEDSQKAMHDAYENIKQSLARLDPTHRDTILEKIKKAVGLQPPGFFERMRERFGTGAQEAVETAGVVAREAIDKADEMIRGSTYDDVMHKLKMTLGVEDPTLWEKIQSSLQPRETVGDRVKHFFGRDTGVTRGKLLARLNEIVEDYKPDLRESYTTKFKKAVGLEEPSLFERIRNKLTGGVESVKEGATKAQEYLTGDSYDDFVDKVKSSLGADTSVWAKVKSAISPEPSIVDKVKGVLGGATGYTKEGFMERIEQSLEDLNPTHRDTILTRIKKGVGLQEPTVMDRIRNKLSGTGAQETLEAAGQLGRETIDRADEIIRGSTFDDTIHQIKVAFGAEDPTVQERILGALHPKESLVDKVKHVFGRDTGISRGQLYNHLKESLSGYDQHKQDSYLQKIKRAMGMEEPEERSFFGRAKEQIGRIFSGVNPTETARDALDRVLTSSKATIDSAIEKLQSSSPESRPGLLQELRKAIDEASRDTQEKSNELFRLFGAKDQDFTSPKTSVGGKLASIYHSLQQVTDSWMKQATEYARYPSTHGQYLLQSSRQENGRSMFYVNDNGVERVDVTGEDVSEKSFDKLKCINSFRREMNLEPYSSLPEKVSVQLHTVKRPHVYLKSVRMMDGSKVEYTFDDGEEDLTVEWSDSAQDKSLTAAESAHLLRVFRQEHGLALNPQHHEPAKIRTNLRKVKDDL